MPVPFPGLSMLLCGYARLRKSGPPIAGRLADRPTTVAVIPALNEERTIPYAISSLARQTVPPDELVVVDDGSTDETAAVVTELADAVPFDVRLVRHDEPMGKTPGIKEVARSIDAKKLFVLDADTYLESEEYLERLLAAHAAGAAADEVREGERAEEVEEGAREEQEDGILQDGQVAADGGTTAVDSQGDGVAAVGSPDDGVAAVDSPGGTDPAERRPVGCAFGRVRPMTRRDRAAILDDDISDLVGEDARTRTLLADDLADATTLRGKLRYLVGRWPVEQYRRTLYDVEQNFVKDGYLRLFGSTMFPAGCGVLYDREELVAVFDEYEESLGDDLTNSEDIFLGFALADRGLANVQVADVTMRTTEPTLRRLPRQLYLWGSAYLQSAYYFGDLSTRLRSGSDDDGPPFGRAVLAQLVDGLYPTTLLVVAALVVFQLLEPAWLLALLVFEAGMYVAVALLASGSRLREVGSVLAAVPVRLLGLPLGAYIYLRVGSDILRGNREWRK